MFYASSFEDSSAYAHFLFEAFDRRKNGAVSFEVSYSYMYTYSYLNSFSNDFIFNCYFHQNQMM